MPTPILRQKFNIEEALEEQQPSQKEVTLLRTPNLGGDAMDSTWDTGLRSFELGLTNAAQDIASSMIVDKMTESDAFFKLSDFIMMMDKEHAFILKLISKLLKAWEKREEEKSE